MPRPWIIDFGQSRQCLLPGVNQTFGDTEGGFTPDTLQQACTRSFGHLDVRALKTLFDDHLVPFYKHAPDETWASLQLLKRISAFWGRFSLITVDTWSGPAWRELLLLFRTEQNIAALAQDEVLKVPIRQVSDYLSNDPALDDDALVTFLDFQKEQDLSLALQKLTELVRRLDGIQHKTFFGGHSLSLINYHDVLDVVICASDPVEAALQLAVTNFGYINVLVRAKRFAGHTLLRRHQCADDKTCWVTDNELTRAIVDTIQKFAKARELLNDRRTLCQRIIRCCRFPSGNVVPPSDPRSNVWKRTADVCKLAYALLFEPETVPEIDDSIPINILDLEDAMTFVFADNIMRVLLPVLVLHHVEAHLFEDGKLETGTWQAQNLKGWYSIISVLVSKHAQRGLV